MHHLKLSLTLIVVLLICATTNAQIQPIELHVKSNFGKPNENNMTKVSLWIPIDTTRELFRWNPDETVIRSFTDDTGKDLLAISRAADDKKVAEGYTRKYLQPEIKDGKWIPGGLTLEFMVKALPDPGASSVTVDVEVVLEYRSDELDVHELELEVPSDNTYRDLPEGETFAINPNGSVSFGEGEKFYMYSILSDLPLVKVELATPDDRNKMEGNIMGPGDFELAYLEPPKKIKMTVKTAGTERVKVPVKVTVDAGL